MPYSQCKRFLISLITFYTLDFEFSNNYKIKFLGSVAKLKIM